METNKNLRCLNAFHHSAIRRIFGIRWEQVREEKITNMEVRSHFNNTLCIKSLILRRTNRYTGKIIGAQKNITPQKLLGAWLCCPRKIGPHNSCNNHFLIAISIIIPEVRKIRIFKNGLPLLVMRACEATESLLLWKLSTQF